MLYAFICFLTLPWYFREREKTRPLPTSTAPWQQRQDQTLEQKQYFSKKNVETLLTHHLFSEKTVF